jgi:hypothetical protein
VAGSCGHHNECLGSIKDGEFLDYVTVSFSRGTLLHGVSCTLIWYVCLFGYFMFLCQLLRLYSIVFDMVG